MTLLEELAKVLNNAIYAGDPMRLESCTGQAHAILSLIQNHPETVERRRRDFQEHFYQQCKHCGRVR